MLLSYGKGCHLHVTLVLVDPGVPITNRLALHERSRVGYRQAVLPWYHYTFKINHTTFQGALSLW